MGLDMYLYKDNAQDGEEVMYWRKANQIHGWFERHCGGGCIENCEPVSVTRGDLKTLVVTCEAVLMNCEMVEDEVVVGHRYENNETVPIVEKALVVKNPLIAAELLPPTEGLFFGGSNYDQWYVQDLKDTVEGLRKVLDDTDEDATFEYYAWW